ncbi:MAG: hypothetical protein ABSG26_25125 [Bryobacteraceae bacterium]
MALIVPWLAPEVRRDIGERVPAGIKKLVAGDNQAIQTTFSSGGSGPKIYLSRAAFIAILEWLAASPVRAPMLCRLKAPTMTAADLLPA